MKLTYDFISSQYNIEQKMRKRIIRIGLIFGLIISVLKPSFAQSDDSLRGSKYIKALLAERKLKDIEMKTDEKSPLTPEEKIGFKALAYYRPKSAYVKKAAFIRYDNPMLFKMKTTTERLPEYALYGQVEFKHKGKIYKLNVYRNIELSKKPGFENYLFIPFNDATNGNQTYGGGRFLDITENGKDVLILDFNKAYNPYCAYNHKYSCPIPPEENELKIKIKAGEMKFH